MNEDNVVTWIGKIRKALRREFEARASEWEVTIPQFLILKRLWQGDGILTSVLTHDAQTDGGTITGLLDRMEAKGLIRRERCCEDRRAVRVYLTPKGRELECPLLETLAALHEHALQGFSVEERAQLLGALKRVGGNVGA